jgi:hypothetical protein
MKRAMTSGSYRGPVALTRQRRTIRFVQVVLVVMAAALLVAAGYSLGRASGLDAGQRSNSLQPPSPPSATQSAVLGALGLIAFTGAILLQGSGVRVPTPARLDELTGRAQQAFQETADAKLASPEADDGNKREQARLSGSP